MLKALRPHGLTIALVGLFLVSCLGQSIAGELTYNQEQVAHGQPRVEYLGYLMTGHFVESIFENWESEFLQMGIYVLLTAMLFQQGSAESRPLDGSDDVDDDPRLAPDKRSAPWPVRQGGWILKLYEHSLSITLLTLFVLSFLLHAAGGARAYSHEQVLHGEAPVSMVEYLGTSQFWFESFQNWQSEFLSIAVLVVLSIFLRERGSPESKPVAAPHGQTGSASPPAEQQSPAPWRSASKPQALATPAGRAP